MSWRPSWPGSRSRAKRRWHGALPAFHAAAGALITDTHGRIMLVKPTYRDDWLLPGGIMEPAESPDQCCAREVKEELGLSLPVGQLLVVDVTPPSARRRYSIIYFVFCCGVLEDPDPIVLRRAELECYEFFHSEEATARLVPALAARLPAALLARASGETIYLPMGNHRLRQAVRAALRPGDAAAHDTAGFTACPNSGTPPTQRIRF